MFKTILLFLILLFVFPFVSISDDSTTSYDESITVDVGDGTGSVIIVGDHNAVYLPPVEDERCEKTIATRISHGFVLVLPNTEIHDGLVKIAFSRIVLFIDDNGYSSVISAEQ